MLVDRNAIGCSVNTLRLWLIRQKYPTDIMTSVINATVLNFT